MIDDLFNSSVEGMSSFVSVKKKIRRPTIHPAPIVGSFQKNWNGREKHVKEVVTTLPKATWHIDKPK